MIVSYTRLNKIWSGGGIGRRPTLVGRESIGSIPIDEMVSLVIGSNPVLTTQKTYGGVSLPFNGWVL